MLKGKTALITGASRGIGKAIALEYARNGASIAVVYVGDTNEADETVAEIAALGVKVKAYYCDVSDFNKSKETVDEIIKEFGGIDILVNNAGITRDNLMIGLKEADYDAVLGVNLKGAFNMTKHCYRNFMKKRSGKIINTSSIVGIIGNPGQTNYSASKAGLIGLTKSVAKELGSRGVCCNAIAPGFIESDMTKDLENKDAYAAQIPLKRFGTIEDVAKVALFLASDLSNYVSGEVIRVDGGMAM